MPGVAVAVVWEGRASGGGIDQPQRSASQGEQYDHADQANTDKARNHTLVSEVKCWLGCESRCILCDQGDLTIMTTQDAQRSAPCERVLRYRRAACRIESVSWRSR